MLALLDFVGLRFYEVQCLPDNNCSDRNYLPSMLKVILGYCFICHIYPPFTRKRIVSLYFGWEVRTRLGVAFFEVYGPPVFHIKVGRPVKRLAQGHNKRTCRLVLHNLPQMPSAKQESCGCHFLKSFGMTQQGE